MKTSIREYNAKDGLITSDFIVIISLLAQQNSQYKHSEKINTNTSWKLDDKAVALTVTVY